MSSTRHAKGGAPISDERYMSSPDLVQIRGISGTAVAAKCRLLASPAKRELLFFLQALSIKQGGLRQLADDVLKMFPNRVGTPSMRRLGMNGQIKYSGAGLQSINEEINAEVIGDDSFILDDNDYSDLGPVRWQDKLEECRLAAARVIPSFILELCINPRVSFHLPREGKSHGIKQFDDIVGALFEYKRQYEHSAVAGFCHTAISRLIWAELDRALKTRTMGLINGMPGRGKTEAIRAWCDSHLGVARFVSLDGTSTKTAQFRELSRVLGIGHSNSRKVQEMQCSVKEVLQSSGIMPVIDEAHFFFEQGTRIYSRPEMLDWIDTALCNPPIPVALITTPQFMTCMERAAIQAEWNYLQFQRRCKCTVVLPPKNTPKDVEAVARHMLPNADSNTIKLIIGYEKLSNRDLSAVGDVVREAKRLAEESGAQVDFEHVNQAINGLLASDQPWAMFQKRVQEGLMKRKAGRRVAATLGFQSEVTARNPGIESTGTIDQTGPDQDESQRISSRRGLLGTSRVTAPVEVNHTLA